MRLSSYADKDDARRATKSEEEVFVSGSPLHRQTMQRAFFDSRQSGRRSPFCGIRNVFPLPFVTHHQPFFSRIDFQSFSTASQVFSPRNSLLKLL